MLREAAGVEAESDEAARYMPGSAIYLGKQNRVLCRAALVSKKHPSDEDCRLWTCGSTRIRGLSFFFGMQKKASPAALHA